MIYYIIKDSILWSLNIVAYIITIVLTVIQENNFEFGPMFFVNVLLLHQIRFISFVSTIQLQTWH